MSGLLVATMSAMAATFYSFISCRYVLVDFSSHLGSFSEMFLTQGAGNVKMEYRISAGLFTWLKPDNELEYSVGECTGYTGVQSDGFGDKAFNYVQYMAVTSVLLSIALLLWMFFMICFSVGKCQLNTMSLLLFIQTLMVGLSFVVLQSGLCKDVGDETSCKLDEGGLICVAAVILWFIAFLVSWLFVDEMEQDNVVVVDGEQTTYTKLNREQKRAAKQEAAKEKKAAREAARKEKRADVPETPDRKSKLTSKTPDTAPVLKSDAADGEMEVVYGKRVGDDFDNSFDL